MESDVSVLIGVAFEVKENREEREEDNRKPRTIERVNEIPKLHRASTHSGVVTVKPTKSGLGEVSLLSGIEALIVNCDPIVERKSE
jgi:hypothetical protein